MRDEQAISLLYVILTVPIKSVVIKHAMVESPCFAGNSASTVDHSLASRKDRQVCNEGLCFLSESLQKHTKRKKSLIDWALRRSTSTPTGSPPSQSPTTPRKLFGLSLSSVCPDGILPKPIMVRSSLDCPSWPKLDVFSPEFKATCGIYEDCMGKKTVICLWFRSSSVTSVRASLSCVIHITLCTDVHPVSLGVSNRVITSW